MVRKVKKRNFYTNSYKSFDHKFIINYLNHRCNTLVKQNLKIEKAEKKRIEYSYRPIGMISFI